MVRVPEVGAGFSFVCVFHCCINKVQCVVSPCCKVHMLVELWQNCLKVSEVELAGYDEKAIGVIGLLLADGAVQFTKHVLSVCTRGNVHSY